MRRQATGHTVVPAFVLLVLFAGACGDGPTPPAAPAAPATPAGLELTALSYDTVRLSWKDASHNETGFRIYRGTSLNDVIMIRSVSANAQACHDVDLLPSTRYFYRVSAFNNHGESDYASRSIKTLLRRPGERPPEPWVAGPT